MFGILILVVLILGAMVVYSYVAKPLISGYQTQTYNQGANDVLTVLLNQIQTQGYVQIPVGNQTLILVPYQPQLVQETPQEWFLGRFKYLFYFLLKKE